MPPVMDYDLRFVMPFEASAQCEAGRNQSMLTCLARPDDTVIALMGITGVGKSTFIQYFTDDNVEVGGSLESCKLITTQRFFRKVKQ